MVGSGGIDQHGRTGIDGQRSHVGAARETIVGVGPGPAAIAGKVNAHSLAIALETAKGEFRNGVVLGAILLVMTLGINILVQTGFRGRDRD